MPQNLLFEIAIVIIAATFIGYIAKLLKQPVIIAYIAAGLLIGPSALGIISDKSSIDILSTLGIALMLFLVGLELDFRKLKDTGKATVIASIVQVGLSIIAAFLISRLLGFTNLESVYIGIAISFSSTLIVVKLLSDKKELDTLHGRIIIGILLIQDIIAIFALVILNSIGKLDINSILISFLKVLFMFGLAIIASFLMKYVFKHIAKSLELLFLTALSWCFLFVGLAYYLDFSVAIGAFLAGLSLASLPYSIEMSGRIKPLRDFFATMFFVSLGMQLVFTDVSRLILPVILLSLVVLLIKPLSTIIPIIMLGYGRKTGFLTSISLAQISEFSLILLAQGFLAGHVSQNAVSLITIIAAITILITTYFIKYDQKIYWKLSEPLKIFDKLGTVKTENIDNKKKFHAILCGHNRIGYSIIKKMIELKKNVLVADFNPEIIKKLKEESIDAIYGDIGDPEVLDKMQIKNAEIVVSTVPDIVDNLLLIKKVKEENKNAMIFVTASQIDEALELYNSGADYVVLPHFLGGEHVSKMIEGLYGKSHNLLRNKLEHIKELNLRKELGHEHPHNI